MTLKELAVVLKLDATQFQTGIKKAADSVDQFGSTLNKSQSASSILSNSMRAVGGDVSAGWKAALGVTANAVKFTFDIIAKATFGMTAILAGTTIEASRFSEAIDNAWRQASDGAKYAGKEYEKFSQTAISIGQDSEFSSIAVAKAMSVIADRARNVAQTQNEVAWATKLASAANIDLSTAADAVSRSMMIFEKQGLTASQASNYLATMVDKGAVNLNDMGMAFRSLFPMAAAMGWQFKDVASVIGVLSTKGIEGFRAIFALQSILDATLDPTKGLGQELANLGVNVVDSTGKVMPLLDILSQLQRLGWTTQDVYKHFGVQMGTVFATIMEAGPKAFTDFRDSMEMSAIGTKTYIDKQEEQLRKKLPHALKELQSSAETTLTQIGSSYATNLTPVLGTLKDWITEIGNAAQKSELLPSVINLLTEALKPAKEGLTGIIEKFSNWAKNVKAEDIQTSFNGIVKGVQDASNAIGKLIEMLEKAIDLINKLPKAHEMPGVQMFTEEGQKEMAAEKLWNEYLKKAMSNRPATNYSKAENELWKGAAWGQFSSKYTERLKNIGIKPAEGLGKFTGLTSAEMNQNTNVNPVIQKTQLQPTYVPLSSTSVIKANTIEELDRLSQQFKTQGLNDVIIDFANNIVAISASSADELKVKLDGIIQTWKTNMNKPVATESIH